MSGDDQRLPAGRGARRRRLRYLERLRELQLRDLGGLVYEAHRRGRDGSRLAEQKLAALAATDAEADALAAALGEERALVHEVREPGVGGECPRCGTLHGSTDRYCSGCALDLEAVRAGAYAGGGEAA